MRNALVFFALSTLAAPAVADTIQFADGRKAVSGITVTDETVAKVEYRRKGLNQPQQYPAEVVLDVEYDVEKDSEYAVGRDSVAGGNVKEGVDLLKSFAANEKQRKGLAAKALYLAGDAQRRSGDAQGAIRTFDELLAAQPDSRYAPLSRVGRGRALLAQGDEAGARKSFESLMQDATAKNYGERWKHEAELRLTMLDEAKDPARAAEIYHRIAAATEKSAPAVANQAKLRIGSAMIASNDFDKAQRFFQTIIDERVGSSPEVIAGAYCGLGRALYQKQQYKDALYCFLRVTTTYANVEEQQAEAHYFAGKSFQHVEGYDGATRSRQHLSRVIRDYPDSPWALEARKG